MTFLWLYLPVRFRLALFYFFVSIFSALCSFLAQAWCLKSRSQTWFVVAVALAFCSFWQMFHRLWKIVIFKLSNSVALRLCLCIVFLPIFSYFFSAVADSISRHFGTKKLGGYFLWIQHWGCLWFVLVLADLCLFIYFDKAVGSFSSQTKLCGCPCGSLFLTSLYPSLSICLCGAAPAKDLCVYVEGKPPSLVFIHSDWCGAH